MAHGFLTHPMPPLSSAWLFVVVDLHLVDMIDWSLVFGLGHVRRRRRGQGHSSLFQQKMGAGDGDGGWWFGEVSFWLPLAVLQQGFMFAKALIHSSWLPN